MNWMKGIKEKEFKEEQFAEVIRGRNSTGKLSNDEQRKGNVG